MSGAPVVAVIGAGPAGCSAADALLGADVVPVLFEGREPGKDKSCGDAVAGDSIPRLRAFGLSEAELRRLGGRPIEAAELISEGRPGRVEHHDAQDVWNVPRRTLDQAMRDLLAAKLELRYCRHVTDIRKEGTRHLRVTARTPQGDDTALDCDAVILAHGAGSPLARRLGIDGLPLGAAAMRAYVDAPELTADRFILSPELVPSYAWAFPLTDGVANVGYGRWRWLAGRGRVRSVAQALIERQGWRRRGSWLGGALPLWSGKAANWHDPDGIVSCGDAAGLVNSRTGEGISHALRSGREAGNAVAHFLQAGRSEAALVLYSCLTRAYYSRCFADDLFGRAWSRFVTMVEADGPAGGVWTLGTVAGTDGSRPSR